MTPQGPIIVKIIEPPGKLQTLGDVIFGAIGLSGVLALLAIVIGVAAGSLFFWIRSVRAARRPSPPSSASSDIGGWR
jgi:hypothetical protein